MKTKDNTAASVHVFMMIVKFNG